MMEFSEKMKKIDFPKYISELRRPIQPPEYIVERGVSSFGTFSSPLKHINFIDCEKPCGKNLPDFLKPFRLKQWFAYLIDFDRGFILSAVYDTGPIRFNVVSFFNKKTRKAQSNMVFTLKKKSIFPDSLLDSRIYLNAGNFTQDIQNNFENGQVKITAKCSGDKKNFCYRAEVRLKSISMPSVVVMPLGENRPLYIHKELFKASGKITVGERTYTLDEKAICAVDDHKGYYPYHMEYDWISGFRNDDTGPMGFNLVDNQVTDPDDYNENFIWINGEMHPLPPITVKKQSEILWFAKDNYDVVNLRFDIEDDFVKKVNVPFFKADYRAPYGKITGYIRDLEGKKHDMAGTFGIGEDLDYRY
jgi:hypothetical protein